MTNLYFPEPFLTFVGQEGDPLYDSPEEEINEFFTRQNLIHDFLEGKTKADEVLDCLIEQGIDPGEYVEEVESSIEFIISNNLIIPDARLWLPAIQE